MNFSCYCNGILKGALYKLGNGILSVHHKNDRFHVGVTFDHDHVGIDLPYNPVIHFNASIDNANINFEGI